MAVKKIQRKCERDFNVCSDCCYFEFTEYIDENYPFKRGRCKKFDKNVDDRWEVKCEERNCWMCENCKYFKAKASKYFEDEYDYFKCEYWDKDVSPYDDICEEFK